MQFQILPLSHSLDSISNKIKGILLNEKHNIIQEKLKELNDCKEYIENIKPDLLERKLSFKNYQICIQENNSNILKPSFQEQSHSMLDRHTIAFQLLISLLVLNTRIYEKCTLICYLLHFLDSEQKRINVRISEMLFLNNKYYFNKKTEEKYFSCMEVLQNEFGYYFSIIIFLRNQLSHHGNNLDEKSSVIFNSDYSALQSVQAINDKLSKEYHHIKVVRSFLDENSSFDMILDRCMLMSDSFFGNLMYEIIQKSNTLTS